MRGVNVGGRAALKMADFRSVLAGLGLDDVQTYLQSGQAVVTCPGRTSATALATSVEKALEAECGLRTRVLALTHDQLTTIIEGNPYPDSDREPTHHVVWFLLDSTPGTVLKDVDLEKFAPEELTVAGQVIYLRLPNGQGRSAMLPVLQRKVTVPVTARNWKTVRKLHDLTA